MSTQQILFPAAVTAQLEILADRPLMGEIGLQDLPAPLVAFFHLDAASERIVIASQIRNSDDATPVTPDLTPSSTSAEFYHRGRQT